ncbi:GNAT family N-acetyltransferase [Streptomyces albidus (ex Kaewkla and Franco 2022)]|uniref:GNAT family N-acetyltransferase n=1 Tax=Streptomyces albidus (ex Kaewkla and Franco 2022) TaxID=722709 RepID=UPI001F186F2B|nr:GNAT family N-acetyltransferase [Streptomyces albidus (ex Kaewkla and Franco 2022)]
MHVREMTAADVDAVAALRVRGWQSAYADLMPRSYLAAMSVAEDAARRRTMFEEAAATAEARVVNLVSESDDGTVTGWAALGPYRPEGPHGQGESVDGAELYALYVLPEHIGTGTGRALMSACLDRAAERGFTRLLLWVVRGNTRARRFYERAGFTFDGAEDTYVIEGTPVPEVRYARDLLNDAA